MFLAQYNQNKLYHLVLLFDLVLLSKKSFNKIVKNVKTKFEL